MKTTTADRMNNVAAALAAHLDLPCMAAGSVPFDGGVSLTFDCATAGHATVVAAALRMLLARDVDAFEIDGVWSVSGTVDAATVARLAARVARAA